MSNKAQGRLHLVYGSDTGMVSVRAAELFTRLTGAGDSCWNEVMDAGCETSEEAAQCVFSVIGALQTQSLFGGEKVVWMKGCSFLGDSAVAKAEATEEALGKLKDLLQQGLPEDVVLVISAAALDKRRSFGKFLLENAQVTECQQPDMSKEGWEKELIPAAEKAAAERGLQFEREALDIFVHRVNTSTLQILNEIEKLDLALGAESRVITKEVIDELVPTSRTGVVFEISRALERRQSDRAIALINFQLDDMGESAVAIIRAAFIPTVTRLLSAAMVQEQFKLPVSSFNAYSAKIDSLPTYAQAILPRKKDGSVNAYPAYLGAQACKRFSVAQLKRILSECLKADKLLVSSSLNERLILHRLAICFAL